MEIVLIIVGTLGVLFFKYRPSLDITKKGDVILWYYKKGKRLYKHLFNIFP